MSRTYSRNPALMPPLPEPVVWQDMEARRLYRHATDLQGPTDAVRRAGPLPVWTRLIQPEYLHGDIARAYGQGPHWHIESLYWPTPLHSDDAQTLCRRVLNGLRAVGRVVDWRDDEHGGFVAEVCQDGTMDHQGATVAKRVPIAWGMSLADVRARFNHQTAGADQRTLEQMLGRLQHREIGIDEASEYLEFEATPWA